MPQRCIYISPEGQSLIVIAKERGGTTEGDICAISDRHQCKAEAAFSVIPLALDEDAHAADACAEHVGPVGARLTPHSFTVVPLADFRRAPFVCAPPKSITATVKGGTIKHALPPGVEFKPVDSSLSKNAAGVIIDRPYCERSANLLVTSWHCQRCFRCYDTMTDVADMIHPYMCCGHPSQQVTLDAARGIRASQAMVRTVDHAPIKVTGASSTEYAVHLSRRGASIVLKCHDPEITVSGSLGEISLSAIVNYNALQFLRAAKLANDDIEVGVGLHFNSRRARVASLAYDVPVGADFKTMVKLRIVADSCKVKL